MWGIVGLLTAAVLAVVTWKHGQRSDARRRPVLPAKIHYEPRRGLDCGGFVAAISFLKPWDSRATLEEVSDAWRRIGFRTIEQFDREMAGRALPLPEQLQTTFLRAMLYNYEGQADRAYQLLADLRKDIERDDTVAGQALATLMYFQGVTALRRGENENCILCRGESSCIIPVSPAAVHIHPEGSRLAIGHFMEYLDQFPDDLGARWLLNLAHMTLGEHPARVDPRYLISLERFQNSEFDIGRFRDIGHLVGINRLNQGGGGLMEDLDNDGYLDLFCPTWDATASAALYRNNGQGAFENRAAEAGDAGQLGGVYAVQSDFNNDGFVDIFVVRGAWLPYPVRPTLFRNNGDGTLTDETAEAGLLHPANSISASWADYDNDGFADLFVCCETSHNRLYYNRGNGTFEETAGPAGIRGTELRPGKGAAWIDFDNDRYPDLYIDYLTPTPGGQLLHNQHDGTFADVSRDVGLDGPVAGFSCWAWDYDNDGWLDIFATSYDRNLASAVKGIMGEPHNGHTNRLYHNLEGRRFEDATREAGLDMVFLTMGSNFGDFDNDGWLDMYLGTGDPDISTLVPNRMFKNVAGRRFAEITGTTRTGNLQKGHSVACGDWDRDGDVDIFIEMGGATNGDKYHNILFQNPGQGNHWLTIRLIGTTSNRSAIGARIKLVTAGDAPLTVHRHISSGSSFGASPLQQTIGVAQAQRIASLEIHWPTSGTTQVYRDVAIDQAIEITEAAESYRKLDWRPIVPVEQADSASGHRLSGGQPEQRVGDPAGR